MRLHSGLLGSEGRVTPLDKSPVQGPQRKTTNLTRESELHYSTAFMPEFGSLGNWRVAHDNSSTTTPETEAGLDLLKGYKSYYFYLNMIPMILDFTLKKNLSV